MWVGHRSAGQGHGLSKVGAVVEGDVLSYGAVTALKDPSGVVGRHVESTAKLVVGVAAEARGLITVVATTNTEDGVRQELHPLVHLCALAVGTVEDETALGISSTVGTVGVELSSCITSVDVHASEVSVTGDLNVLTTVDEGSTSDRAIWDETCTTAAFCAVRYRVALVSRDGSLDGGSEQTPVIDA